MGRDNQPKERQLNHLARKQNTRAPHARILIVCEGSKTEPNYFKEIRSHLRLNSANITIQHSLTGTSPLQVVEYAEDLFRNGNNHKQIRPCDFDKVYVVFDRDDHKNFHNALAKAKSLDGILLNHEKQNVQFKAIPSIPCFEFWLLLHYEDVKALLSCNEVSCKLKTYYPKYVKAANDVFKKTRGHLEIATKRAKKLNDRHDAHQTKHPHTAVGELVTLLINLKK